LRYKCQQHGVEVEVSGNSRRFLLPPVPPPGHGNNPAFGVPHECALFTAPDIVPGELPRLDGQGRRLQGACTVVEAT
jgi:hypothetical protein